MVKNCADGVVVAVYPGALFDQKASGNYHDRLSEVKKHW